MNNLNNVCTTIFCVLFMMSIVLFVDLKRYSRKTIILKNQIKDNDYLEKYYHLIKMIMSEANSCRKKWKDMYQLMREYEKNNRHLIFDNNYKEYYKKLKDFFDIIFEGKEYKKFKKSALKRKLGKNLNYFRDLERMPYRDKGLFSSSFHYAGPSDSIFIKRILCIFLVYPALLLIFTGLRYASLIQLIIIPIIAIAVLYLVLTVVFQFDRDILIVVGLLLFLLQLNIRIMIIIIANCDDVIDFILRNWGVSLLLIGIITFILTIIERNKVKTSYYNQTSNLSNILKGYNSEEEENRYSELEELQEEIIECFKIIDEDLEEIKDQAIRGGCNKDSIIEMYWKYRRFYILLNIEFGNNLTEVKSREDMDNVLLFDKLKRIPDLLNIFEEDNYEKNNFRPC